MTECELIQGLDLASISSNQPRNGRKSQSRLTEMPVERTYFIKLAGVGWRRQATDRIIKWKMLGETMMIMWKVVYGLYMLYSNICHPDKEGYH